MSDPAAILQRGLAAHRAGDLASAEAAYRAVLAADPAQAEAAHGLGIIRHRQGQAAEAVALLSLAVTRAPQRPEFHFNHGLAQLAAGDAGAAVAAFATASRLSPDWPEAQYDLGNAHREAGDPQAAARAFRQALKLRPGYIQAEVNLANLLKDEGKLDQAIASYRRVLARHPHLPETLNNLGSALNLAGQRPEAEAAFRAALAQKPDFAAALTNLGALLLIEGREARRQEGRAALRRALSLLPAALLPLDLSLMRAECQLALTDFAGAVATLRDACARFPQAWRPRLDLAEALAKWGRFAEAEAALPAQVPAAAQARLLTCRAALHRDQGRLDAAEADQRAALALAPGNPAYRYALATMLLPAGRFAEGFAAFDARIELFRPSIAPGRAWDGRAPRGKSLLILGEEGLGDVIQFARFIPRLIQAGARVTLQVERPLLRLLAGLAGGATLIAPGQPGPPTDGWALVMSLPRLMGLGDPTALGAPYLAADSAPWLDRLRQAAPAQAGAGYRALCGDSRGPDSTVPDSSVPDSAGQASAGQDSSSADKTGQPLGRQASQAGGGEAQMRRVGLVWAGNPSYGADHLRSLPPSLLAPLAEVPGVTWVSLQKGAPADAIPGLTLLCFDNDLHDMADTAGLVAALDLVITVDTAVAHLAGALGKPVWLLNRFNSCWRWERAATSVWYHSLRQFRQTEPGDWTGPVARVVAALRQPSR